jgi:alpha-beta hydrolase superfamily lysophospholipase
MGHSMGCMVINTYLLKNPDIKLCGVIFSAPFFGFSENFEWNWYRKIILKIVADPINVSP